MKLVVHRTSSLQGELAIPSSKSHTIRAVLIASLADGISHIKSPLSSDDTMAIFKACQHLGAVIEEKGGEEKEGEWIVTGFNGSIKKSAEPLNMLNSGTSANLIAGVIAALCEEEVTIDGDESLRTRPMQPLLTALNNLGAQALSLNNNGRPPVLIRGKMLGGKTDVNGISSQFVSSLLIACPLLEEDSEINVVNQHEKPYIEMTCRWLDEQNIQYEKNETFSHFKIKGKQSYKPFEKLIPADWSSAAFPLVAAALTQSDVLIKGVDVNDVQGDKAIIDYLKKMGANIAIEQDGIRVKGGELTGVEVDLNATPDLLPAMAVAGCFASGSTKLHNVAHARIKETDRIKVLAEELSKMNAQLTEMDDGLIIHQSQLKGAKVRGHNDHRIVMALALAGLIAAGKTEITTAEAIKVTFPNFIDIMKSIGAHISINK